MRLLVLFLLASSLGALEVEGLPKEVIVDPKQIVEGKDYDVLNVGYVTRCMQDSGYLSAKVVQQNEVMKAIPGDRYTIREITIKGGVHDVHKCEIVITPDNMSLLRRIFADCDWDSSIIEEGKSVHYTYTPK